MALPGTPCARLRGSMLAALLTISMLIGLAITATASGSPARLGFHVLRPTAVVGQLTASRRGVDEHHTHAAIHRAIPKAHEDGAYVYDGVVEPSVQTCSPHSSRASSDRAVEPVHREDGRGVRLRAPPVVAAEGADAAATTVGKEITTYYPPNRGFLGSSARQTLESGTRIDRYGGEGGHFASPAGTPMEMRALSPGARGGALNTYEVLTPFETDAGTVAPWFGQLGLGTQYDLPGSIADLLEGGFLKALP